MKHQLKFKTRFSINRLQEKGVAHYILPLAAIVLVGLVGTAYVVVSRAATPSYISGPIHTVSQTPANVPLGLYESGNNLQYPFPATPKYAIQYYGWQEGFQTADASTAWSKGTETFAELQTCGNPCDSTGVPINNVIDGSYDSYLTSFADSVKAFNHPVLLTFDHEFNGSWYPWGDSEITATQWKDSWDHVTSVISKIAPNVTWVWAPNIEEGAASFNSYWPGTNEHVGMVGLDGYYSSTSATWANTFAGSVSNINSVSGNKYGFIVAEIGVKGADSNNLTQIANLSTGARGANAKAVMYFDSSSWLLSSSEQSQLVSSLK
jgi:hypothetical protein